MAPKKRTGTAEGAKPSAKRVRQDHPAPAPSASTSADRAGSPDANSGAEDENLDAAFVSDGESEGEKARGPAAGRAAKARQTAFKTHQGVLTYPSTGHADDLVGTAFPDGSDYRHLALKPDHASRPLYISPSMSTRTIILEAFHPLAAQAQDFLIAVSEPVSRPSYIHEYKLTKHSLQAAISVGLQTEDIIDVLNRLSKVRVSTELAEFIRESTASYGKVKLVLKKNSYHVESSDPEVLRRLLRDSIINQARLTPEDAGAQTAQEGAMVTFGLNQDSAPKRGDLVIPGTTKPAAAGPGSATADPSKSVEDDLFGAIIGVDNADENDDDDAVHSFEVKGSEIENVKRRCAELDYPMLEEYDFRNDTVNPTLDIDLKPATQIRPYQEKSLSKMFGNGRARSGIIVLPCGAGKTLVGITAASTIRKSVLCLCTSGVSVMQWRQQFLMWSNIQDRQISVFTADQKEKFAGASGIVVSTYSMVANRAKRSHDSQKMMDFLTSREWGLIILDEVHVVPAAMFRRVVGTIKAHAKLGLTATLVREDDKIDDLNFLIGPKLYEANWMDLAAKGHIANVQCAEVWCPMTPEFYREYLREKSRKRNLLYCMNPQKFQACQFLIKFHEERGDKIIVFSDNVYALEAYAKKLRKLFIHGGTPQVERMRILQNFQHNPLVNTIFLSKVGDTSIDLPEATCLIQISSHFGSRRQEAQRLGRILRAKRRNDEGFNAFFYSLVSRDTQEFFFSTKRQQFLIDQGYAFKVISHLQGLEQLPELVYSTKDEQIELLQSVLLANESDGEVGNDVRMLGDEMGDGTGKGKGRGTGNKNSGVRRVVGKLSALSGGQSMSYVERNKSANKQLAKEQPKRNKIFAKRDEAAKKKRKDKDQTQEAA